jgi:hypothetical protein
MHEMLLDEMQQPPNTTPPNPLPLGESTNYMPSDNTKTLVRSLYIYIPFLKRLIILAMSAAALFIFHQFAQNGRYQTSYGGIILDTRTGATFRLNPGSHLDVLSEPVPEDGTEE